VIGGRTLLDTAIEACGPGAEIVVVGPRRPTLRQVHWTLEEPPGGGPLAALAAGVAALPGEIATVTVLAADLPSVTPDVVARLNAALLAGDNDAVLLSDAQGNRQPLLAAYRAPALHRALTAVGEHHGRPMKALLAQLRLSTISDPDAAEDIDTITDLLAWTPDGRQPRGRTTT
jgi:molybdopterin-guanine dinucleotide biosynthesis protein A